MNNFERMGESVDITSVGDIIVIGGINVNSGVVRVYSLNSNNWQQIAGDIIGESNGDQFGSSVGISNDGYRIICGAPKGGNGSFGYVKVYTQGTSWIQVGQKIEGESLGCQLGGYYGVDISDLHDKIVVGEKHNNTNGNSSGKARVFFYSNNLWVFAGEVVGGVRWG